MTTFRSANPFDQLSPGVKNLLVTYVVVFLLQMLMPANFQELLALRPSLVVERFYFWQLFTYSFLHGGFWHLFFNAFALWMFASHIEFQWGTKRFLIYYAVCVLGAAACQFIFAPDQTMVGASGGIYGLLIAFGLMFPDSVIYLFFIFPLRAIQAVIFISLLTLASAVSSGGSRVAHFAHLGGMVAGFLMMKGPGGWDALRSRWNTRTSRRSARVVSKLRVISPDDDELKAEVDRILEKISAQGLESLTEKEHETMRRYAKQRK